MLRICAAIVYAGLTLGTLTAAFTAQQDEQQVLSSYRQAASGGGDAARGKTVFDSTAAGCAKCHVLEGQERRAGPNLLGIADKYARDQLVRAVLEPNANVHPDYGTIAVVGKDGRVQNGVLFQRNAEVLKILNGEGKLVQVPVSEIQSEQRIPTSLMPTGIQKGITREQFADLIAYLETLKQPRSEVEQAGMPDEIPWVETAVRLEPVHSRELRFDHPVWVIPVPGSKRHLLIVEQKTRKIWRLETGPEPRRALFADFSSEATTGEFEGVVCLAFHPRFLENRKYYVNYHVRNQGSFFSPVIVERQAAADFARDAGMPSKRIMQIHQDTDLHWGGMLAFGPDGYLYIGAGDAGPQEDPDGHSQDLSLLTGSILCIDVDHPDANRPYSIPKSNPFYRANSPTRPEIWAAGYRMPWRFSFDPVTNDLWVGDIGQYLFEEVSICRSGENHGWNVWEGFHPFSDRYRRDNEQFTAPVFAYRRKHGVSVTGGYVYRGKRNASLYGKYIFGDFESKRIWALDQADRKLLRVRQIGESPERISSFGLDAEGEILLVGYEGTISRLVLDDVDFGRDRTHKLEVHLRNDGKPATGRVTVRADNGKYYAPAGATKRSMPSPLARRDEEYFYAAGDFFVTLPAGKAELTVYGGLEVRPQTVHVQPEVQSELTVEIQPWIDMNSRGWYSGDSHVHLHTGGPIQVSVEDAMLAARAEGVNYVNLCASNNLGNDIRDAGLITGRPHPLSNDRYVAAFGEEMRSMIYGHMQFLGIRKLVEPQYTGFENTPNYFDYPANFQMAKVAADQGAVVTYAHPMFAGQPFPFDEQLDKPNGAARELPVDAALGVAHAIDLMSYNSDENESAKLWYRLLNCGLRISACVGTDALLDRSTRPLGGARVYVHTNGPFSAESWLTGLKAGRTCVTSGPIPFLKVNGKGPGETVMLENPSTVQVELNVMSPVANLQEVSLIVNGASFPILSAKESKTISDHRVRNLNFELELPVERSCWVALQVIGSENPTVSWPAWAHTSPVYVSVGGQEIASPSEAQYFVDWIDQLLRVVLVRNRYASSEDRRQVEDLFRRAQEKYRDLARRGAETAAK